MKNKMINKILLAAVVVFTISSCAKKLDLFPQNDLTPEKAYATAAERTNHLRRAAIQAAAGLSLGYL